MKQYASKAKKKNQTILCMCTMKMIQKLYMNSYKGGDTQINRKPSCTGRVETKVISSQPYPLELT